MIRYFKNIITGNFAHWNKTHNKQISDLWNKTENLNDVEIIIAQQSIIASRSITENYIGPNRKNELTWHKLSLKNIRSLKYSDYEKMVMELIRLFLILLSIRNTVLKTYCLSIFMNVFNEKLIIKNELDSISEDRIKEIIFSGLDKFIKASKILRNQDPILSYSFFTLVTLQIEPMEQKFLEKITKSKTLV